MYLWRELIPWRRDLALLAVLLMAALMAWGELSTFGPPLLGYATLYLARSARLAGWDRWGDPSYGLYILAFPLQQLTAQLGARVWWANLLGVLPMALALAYASWHLIESPALHLKDRFPFQGSRQRSGALPTSAD